ncbi:hypothetical protein [Leptothoe kymatousa]|uniref:Uncharacterized protein n=1 Tax=Leptothoe kymatousa TAU-MAC 1615 TaxID=2364775 RepID=A0ABS5XZH3_9CYAN|nr:hypothetical protein [Leptothoe kymatousa]MBT9310999.1 hypothetical protein [Leptothoe kymatousa TAU-MAC 1615]
MALSKTESKQLLERIIFEETAPKDWAQDIWGLSAMHGEEAAKLLDIFDALIECCSEEKLENLVQGLIRSQTEV